VKASRERIRLSKPKCGFVGRLVPYGDLHYETGCSIPFAADCVARLDALFRKAGPRALEIYPDPVQFLVGLRRGFLGDSPPRTLPQAEALAAFLFNVAEFPFTVEEVKARFLDLRCPSEIFHGCGLIKVRSPEEFEALTRAIVALWNYTKRSRPGDPAGKEACNHSSPKATTHLVTFEPVDENYGRVRVVSKGDEDSRG